jgi:hypothetical protein
VTAVFDGLHHDVCVYDNLSHGVELLRVAEVHLLRVRQRSALDALRREHDVKCDVGYDGVGGAALSRLVGSWHQTAYACAGYNVNVRAVDDRSIVHSSLPSSFILPSLRLRNPWIDVSASDFPALAWRHGFGFLKSKAEPKLRPWLWPVKILG